MKIVILLLVIGGFVLYLGRVASSPAAPSAVVPEAAPPRAPVAAPAPSERPRPRPNEVSVEITEAELTRQLSQDLMGLQLGQTPLGSPTLERIDVRLRDGQAGTSGSARLAGVSVPFSSSLAASPDGNGRVRVSLTDARISGVPLPEAARAQLEGRAQVEIDRLLSRTPMRVRSIEIGDGKLRAIGAPAT